MPSISLLVIFSENCPIGETKESDKHIFINAASDDLCETLEKANKENRIPILVNGIFDLVVDDPKVIRRKAQKTNAQSEDFVSLYSFLSCWPNEAVEFEW